MEKKLADLLESVLKTTTPLAQMGAEHDTAFLNVLLGIYRVSFSTLRDIYYLSLNEETGASALDLTRKIAVKTYTKSWPILSSRYVTNWIISISASKASPESLFFEHQLTLEARQ